MSLVRFHALHPHHYFPQQSRLQDMERTWSWRGAGDIERAKVKYHDHGVHRASLSLSLSSILFHALRRYHYFPQKRNRDMEWIGGTRRRVYSEGNEHGKQRAFLPLYCVLFPKLFRKLLRELIRHRGARVAAVSPLSRLSHCPLWKKNLRPRNRGTFRAILCPAAVCPLLMNVEKPRLQKG